MTKPKRKQRPYGFWKRHQEEIIKDISTIGVSATKRKWSCPATTWKSYLPLWISNLPNPPPVEMLCPKPCPEIMKLKGIIRALGNLTHGFTELKGAFDQYDNDASENKG